MFGHLVHFLLDFLNQMWTQRTLRHILGPILVIFGICHFLVIPGLFEYLGGLRKSKFSQQRSNHFALISSVVGGEVPRLNHGLICFPIQNTKGMVQAAESRVPLFDIFTKG